MQRMRNIETNRKNRDESRTRAIVLHAAEECLEELVVVRMRAWRPTRSARPAASPTCIALRSVWSAIEPSHRRTMVEAGLP